MSTARGPAITELTSGTLCREGVVDSVAGVSDGSQTFSAEIEVGKSETDENPRAGTISHRGDEGQAKSKPVSGGDRHNLLGLGFAAVTLFYGYGFLWNTLRTTVSIRVPCFPVAAAFATSRWQPTNFRTDLQSSCKSNAAGCMMCPDIGRLIAPGSRGGLKGEGCRHLSVESCAMILKFGADPAR